ncbi:MAG: hypothetical protein GC206_01330 [Alphaproteobacteria bacterium]|nr:hypothetical protein [Alphaproteobacteria bacterium]
MLASTMLAGHAVATAQPSTEESDTARTMDATYIAVPVVREGRLVNYLFVSVRVDIANGVDLWRTREKAHFLRDALVRAAHAGPLADAERDDRLNERAAVAAFRTAAREALGERAVRAVSILSVHSSRTQQARR